MARLKLLDLRCIRNEEVGGDEVYLKVGGQKVWATPRKMLPGSVESLRSVAPIAFDGTIQIGLWEDDTLKDDHLGAASVGTDKTAWDYGEFEIKFTKGAEYVLICEVFNK